MRDKSSKPKEKAKIQRRMNLLTKRGQIPKPAAVVEQPATE